MTPARAQRLRDLAERRMITPGRLAYEEDCRLEPDYPDGAPRKTWDQLDELSRGSWEKNPTPRAYHNKEVRNG